MKNKDSRKNIPVPPADVILDLLNQKGGAIEELYDFYGGYIRSASSIPVLGPNGMRESYCFCEDLMQEIHIKLFNSLPALRRNIYARRQPPHSIIIVVSQ